jgi:hypothetical protein
MLESNTQFFTTHVQEDEDGNFVLEFPDEILDAVGWVQGDELEFSAFGNRMQITKVQPGSGDS